MIRGVNTSPAAGQPIGQNGQMFKERPHSGKTVWEGSDSQHADDVPLPRVMTEQYANSGFILTLSNRICGSSLLFNMKLFGICIDNKSRKIS